jgi:hypothetical protein
MPCSAGSSPLLLKSRARTAGSSSGGGGSSGCLSDGGSSVAASITPTAAAAIAAAAGSSSDVQGTGSDDGSSGKAAAAAAVAVQQRGRFTVRQESRPSSRPSSAHGSKAGSPRASIHHTGLSKLGSKWVLVEALGLLHACCLAHQLTTQLCMLMPKQQHPCILQVFCADHPCCLLASTGLLWSSRLWQLQ